MKKKEIELFKRQFGENLKKIREKKKKTLLDIQYNSSLDNSKVSKIEHGRFNIQLSTILELSKGLDVPPKMLFDFDTESSPE